MGILTEMAKRLAQGAKPAAKAAQPAEELGAKYLTKTPGPAAAGRVFTSKELNELRDQLQFYTQPRALSPERAQSLQMLLKQAEEPGVNTHVLYTGKDFTEPASAFQLMSEHELGDIGNYMPNLVSLLGGKGTGTQAVTEARRAGPYGLVNTPHSRPFYDKLSERLPGFSRYNEAEFEGTAHQYKKRGGLVQYSERCKCHG